jgi:hypothetical protein
MSDGCIECGKPTPPSPLPGINKVRCDACFSLGWQSECRMRRNASGEIVEVWEHRWRNDCKHD